MSSAEAERANLAGLSRRFPRHAANLRRLAAADETFAGLCADYELALASVARLTPQPGQPSRPEIAEYRVIIAELEAEIMRTLRKAGVPSDAGRFVPPATPPARRPGQPIFYRDPLTRLQMLHWLEPGDRLPRRICDGMCPEDRALLAAHQLPGEAGERDPAIEWLQAKP